MDQFSPKPFEKNTLRSYEAVIDPYSREFGEREVGQITPNEILSFLNRLTDGNRPYTKKVRYSQLSCFFNFVCNNIDPESANPCDTPIIRKLYRQKVKSRWEVIEKETIDEIIFRTTENRNRLLLELMARGCVMRIGEVLKLRLKDLQDQKLILQAPKSGRVREIVFIPQKVADRLRDYAHQVFKNPEDRIFPISYEAAGMVVLKAGRAAGIQPSQTS